MLIIEFYRLYYQYLEYLSSIEQIKTKFKFRNDFSFDDWHDWLREIKSWSDLYKEYEDLTIAREMKSQFKDLVSAADKLIGLLDTFRRKKDENDLKNREKTLCI
jgi:hypothetical protein